MLHPAKYPNCMLSIFMTDLTHLLISFQNLRYRLQQLIAPVWTTCHCITLTSVNIHHPTPAPILEGTLPSFTTILHTSVIHNVPFSPAALIIFCHNSCWTCWLALLHRTNIVTPTSNAEIFSLGQHTRPTFVKPFHSVSRNGPGPWMIPEYHSTQRSCTCCNGRSGSLI